MPVNYKPSHNREVLYQRRQYEKRGISRLYWDYRDKRITRYIKGRTILDIGCGEGVTLEKIIRCFPQRDIKGIDYLNENVEICKRHDLPVEYGDVYRLNFTDNFFDTCLFIEVIEHLDDHVKALREIHRVLKRGGSLILLFPNDRNFKITRILTGKFKEAFYDAGHARQWTPKTMKKALEHSSFKVSKIENIPFYFWRCSLHCLTVAKKK